MADFYLVQIHTCFEQNEVTLSLVLTTVADFYVVQIHAYFEQNELTLLLHGVDYRWQNFTWYRYMFRTEQVNIIMGVDYRCLPLYVL